MGRLQGIALLLGITLLSSCSPTTEVQATPASALARSGSGTRKS